MKYFFFIQGEGRGHLMQAITLKEKLEHRGHEVSAVFVSTGPARKLPDFFQQRIGLTIKTIGGPVFIPDKNGKGVSFKLSLLESIRGLRNWPRFIREIRQEVQQKNPDALISFYEPLSSFYRFIYSDRRPFFVIGHQFLAEHSIFPFPKGYYWEKKFFILYNKLLSLGKTKKIALSFTKENDEEKKHIFVCPPLIRQEIIASKPQTEDYAMVYLLNHGYGKEIVDWCRYNPTQSIEAFCDHSELVKDYPKNLKFNPLNDYNFAECLRKCSTYLSTAGFESICEAAYLDKNIIMTPTKNHYEQLCNACDARRAGIAIMSKDFDLNKLYEKTTLSTEKRKLFRDWVDSNNGKIVEILENTKQ